MAKKQNNQQPNETVAGTNVNKVQQQNQASKGQGQGQFGTEFASETDAQQVRQQNKKSQQNKK